MLTEVALDLRDVSKRFGTTEAVRGVSLEVVEGEIVGLLGPNGAGKSTTLRLIAGLAKPDSGTVTIAGHSLATDRAAALACAGFLIENPALPPELSCRNALRYVDLLGGGRQGPDRIDSALRAVGLADAATKTFRQLSLGMRQRLGIAAALFGGPKIVVLDEPMNGLDPAGIREISNLMRSLAENGAAVLLSSHLLDEVERTANRVAVMANGRIIAIEAVNAGATGRVAKLFFSLTQGQS